MAIKKKISKIGLISDVHATPAPVAEAWTIFQKEGVDRILCPGDIAGYGSQLDETVALLIEMDCQAILGNHELWYLERMHDQPETAISRYFSILPATLSLNIEGKKLRMVHASPPQSVKEGIRLLDQDGNLMPDQKDQWGERLAGCDDDILIVGHTHQMFAEQLGGTLVINPGSSAFNHSCAVLTLPDMTCRFFPLSNKSIVKAWNWGSGLANNNQ